LPHLLVVLVILLLIFGPSRLGDLGSSLGNSIRGFKRAVKESDEIDVIPSKEASQIQSPGLKTRSKTIGKEEAK
jgi:sec-independent protein translocase protein TatA